MRNQHITSRRDRPIYTTPSDVYADFANLGLLPHRLVRRWGTCDSSSLRAGRCCRAALTDVEAGAVKVFRERQLGLGGGAGAVVDNLETWAAPATNGVQGSGIPVDAETLLGADEVHRTL